MTGFKPNRKIELPQTGANKKFSLRKNCLTPYMGKSKNLTVFAVRLPPAIGKISLRSHYNIEKTKTAQMLTQKKTVRKSTYPNFKISNLHIAKVVTITTSVLTYNMLEENSRLLLLPCSSFRVWNSRCSKRIYVYSSKKLREQITARILFFVLACALHVREHKHGNSLSLSS